MEIKKKLYDLKWGLIEKIIGIIIDAIFYLAKKYPKSFFKKFIPWKEKKKLKEVITIAKKKMQQNYKGRPGACNNIPGKKACIKKLTNGAKKKKVSSICRQCKAPEVRQRIKRMFLKWICRKGRRMK